MDGYLTGILLTPNLEMANWIAGLWVSMPPLAQDDRVQPAFLTVLARFKSIDSELQKGWPGYQPSFCARATKPDHDIIREWMKGFYKAMKLDPDYWSDLADGDRTPTFVGLLVGFIDTG